MTQAFGCIDGTHIPIRSPSENPQDFFCYKQYYDYQCKLNVECMWSGSAHDAKVFANFSINKALRNNKLPKTFQTPIVQKFRIT